jgi:hypothetical protein
MIYDSMDLYGLSNPHVTRDSSSLMIFDSVGPVWVVEYTSRPLQQVVDDF